jgi:sigma-B regulation protein RsbU (phosphoserine phosphatase)
MNNNLELIVEMMARYSKGMSIESSLSWALPQILASIQAEAGSFFFYEADDKTLNCTVCVGPVNIKGLKFKNDQGVAGKVFTSRESQLIEDVSLSTNHLSKVDQKTGFVTKSIMTVPVAFGDDVFGCLQALNSKKSEFFTHDDLLVLEGLAINLAMSLKNISLSDRLLEDKLIQKDISDARQAQSVLFPKIDSFSFISGGVQPYRQLSGDFIDYFEVGSKIAFIQGDVSGKGVPATILMSKCSALFRLFAKQELSANEIAIRMNQEIFGQGTDDRFITCLLGWFDHTNSIEFVNCGHNPLIHYIGSGAIQYEPSAPPLGVVANNDFAPTQETITLNKNHAAYISTDGITEAKIKGKEIGLSGIIQMASEQAGLSAPDRYDQVKKYMARKDVQLHDDATLLVILPKKK